jgi:predicted CoA-binding protein/RimJ/RimL family protein N-acetyltransferase
VKTRYPAELEQPGLLRDGRSVFIRPVRADDEEAMLDFARRLSRRTLAQRLLGPVPRFHRELLRQFVDVDYTDHLALAAFLDDRLIGTGRLIRLDDSEHAEVTFTVADEFQGMGLGALLCERLAAAAPAIGVYVFEADVLSTNTAMLRVFAASGYDLSITAEGHLQHVVLRVDNRAGALARMSRREHRAARRSLEKLLAPRAVAVIGANRQAHTIGHQILANLIKHGFPGPVYPVNPAADQIAGRPAAARVQDLPQPVDLALIAVPPEALADAIRDCAEAKAGAVVVVTAGAPGDADARRAASAELARFVRSHGMRMVGPTSMGVLSARDGTAMHASFAPVHPPAGGVAMSSQSGPLGLAIHSVDCLSNSLSGAGSARAGTTSKGQPWPHPRGQGRTSSYPRCRTRRSRCAAPAGDWEPAGWGWAVRNSSRTARCTPTWSAVRRTRAARRSPTAAGPPACSTRFSGMCAC